MTTYFPKVLIIGQSFNKKNGGGVTLSNLFKGWPKDRVVVASNANLIADLDISVCDTYYQLGYNHKLHPFPLNLILPKIKCGLIKVSDTNKQDEKIQPVKSGKYKIVYQWLTAVLHFFGLYNVFYKLKITPEFSSWIKEYNPDVIYTQLASLELIRFVDKLHEHTKRPIAIHIMDDWPLTINKPGILYPYWQNCIDKEFRKLQGKSAVLMSICDAMSDEYKLRYGNEFIPFHNPIDINYWKPAIPKDYTIKDKFTILYAGRIGFGIEDSIADVAKAVNEIVKTIPNIVFEIQTPDIDLLNKLITFNENVKWVKPIAYSDLPAKFSSADVLLLPQDFDKHSVAFLKYSFPTKVSEYMISGSPILVYGDTSTGLTKYAIKGQWCHVVTENSTSALIAGIKELYNNQALRQQLSHKAQQIAIETEDALIVKENFRKSLLLN